MIFLLLAEFTVVVHFLFIVFVILGALAAFKWPKILILHIPAVIWVALMEFFGWYCPLTPLEVKLRLAAGTSGYEGGFIEHYIMPLIYPAALSRNLQVLLGVLVVAINGLIYFLVYRHHRPFRKPRR